jgi:hypothetical protein
VIVTPLNPAVPQSFGRGVAFYRINPAQVAPSPPPSGPVLTPDPDQAQAMRLGTIPDPDAATWIFYT